MACPSTADARKDNDTMKQSDLIRKAMSALGSRKSDAKSAAAKTNGAKGGRPPKKPMIRGQK